MSDDRGYRSSEDYTGTVEEATVALSSNKKSLAMVLSSGETAKRDRDKRKDNKVVSAIASTDPAEATGGIAGVLRSGDKARENRGLRAADMASKGAGSESKSSNTK